MKESDPIVMELMARMRWGRDKNVRAINYLMENPDVGYSLVALREYGKFDVPQQEADAMVAIGLMNHDENGYYMSDAAEEFVDKYIQLREKKASPQGST